MGKPAFILYKHMNIHGQYIHVKLFIFILVITSVQGVN